ncbi:hypothetical protein [Spirillospora sp. CA-128828]|uniref:hypothetical protein n=1 Tax=Spirillospora sp. CA-128828 TaxID=3240033 RepID=UPI003D8F19C7
MELRSLAARFVKVAAAASRGGTDAAFVEQQHFAVHIAMRLARLLGLMPATLDPAGPTVEPVGVLRPVPPVQQVRVVACTPDDITELLQVGDRVFVRRQHGGIESWDDARMTRRYSHNPVMHSGSAEVTTVFGEVFTIVPGGTLHRPPRDGEGWALVPLTPAYGSQVTLSAVAEGLGPQVGVWLADEVRSHLRSIGVGSVRVAAQSTRMLSARRVDVYTADGKTLQGEAELADLLRSEFPSPVTVRQRRDWLQMARRMAGSTATPRTSANDTDQGWTDPRLSHGTG